MYCRGDSACAKSSTAGCSSFRRQYWGCRLWHGWQEPSPRRPLRRGHPGPRGRHGGDARAAEFDSRHARHRPISSHQRRDSLAARTCDLPPSGSWEARHPQIGNLHFRQWRLLERWRELAAASAGDRLAWISRHRAGQNPQWSGCHGVAHGGPASAQECRSRTRPTCPNLRRASADLLSALDWALAQSKDAKSPYFQKIDPNAVAISGLQLRRTAGIANGSRSRG